MRVLETLRVLALFGDDQAQEILTFDLRDGEDDTLGCYLFRLPDLMGPDEVFFHIRQNHLPTKVSANLVLTGQAVLVD